MLQLESPPIKILGWAETTPENGGGIQRPRPSDLDTDSASEAMGLETVGINSVAEPRGIGTVTYDFALGER